MPRSLTRAINDLEESKRRFDEGDVKIRRALSRLANSKSMDATALVRFHEALLFFRAYPPSTRVLRQVEQILKTFAQRVKRLSEAGMDLSALDDPEVSGIVGTSVTSNFSYAVVRWLVKKWPAQVSIDWDWFEEEDRFGATMPRFLPLLEEDALVEAHVPYHEWLRAAKGRRHELVWLIERFESLDTSDRRKAELYDSLKLHVRWKFGFRASRTGMKQAPRAIFFHHQPLIQRRDVSLVAELQSPPIAVAKLSRSDGDKILELARETSAVRYRELHGFTYGDPRRVLKAELGRGTEAFVMGVSPEHRLPLRAYHAALILKNGVPIAYFEGLSIFERMESGFNLYYTFREGETAWLYARVLRLMRQLFGVTVYSIDPYQVGDENEEGIESGAFWFYRKMGFRPVRSDVLKLTLAEERKLAAKERYRTPARMLRKLAAGHMLFDLRAASEASGMPRTSARKKLAWDSFHIRNLGLAVQRRMAREYAGDAERIRTEAIEFVTHALGFSRKGWSAEEESAFGNLAVVLAMVPDLERWITEDKQLAAQIVRAKGNRDEARYLRLMQEHEPLREAIIRLGS